MKRLTNKIKKQLSGITLLSLLNGLYSDYLKSIESKIVFVGMIISIILSLFSRIHPIVLCFKIVIYLVICNQINCMIYGDCRLSASILFLIPITGITIQVLDLTGYFDDTKKNIKRLQSIIGGDNPFLDSSIIFDDDKDIEKHVDENIDKYSEKIVKI